MLTKDFLERLAESGGVIVSSNECTSLEITHARAEGHFLSLDNGLGFVIRPQAWVEKQKNINPQPESEGVDLLVKAALAEVVRARYLHPGNDHLTSSFAEEAGEVVKAVNNFREGKGPIQDVDKEIVHCMAMCIRLWEEGDPAAFLSAPMTALHLNPIRKGENNSGTEEPYP